MRNLIACAIIIATTIGIAGLLPSRNGNAAAQTRRDDGQIKRIGLFSGVSLGDAFSERPFFCTVHSLLVMASTLLTQLHGD